MNIALILITVAALISLSVYFSSKVKKEEPAKPEEKEPPKKPEIEKGEEKLPELPELNRLLMLGAEGPDVYALQEMLVSMGISVGSYGIDGEFGPDTKRAVNIFKRRAELSEDGIVDAKTWTELGGVAKIAKGDVRKQLARFARSEAKQGLVWSSKNSKAEKYLEPFRGPMQKLGQLGAAPVFYNWCAAFVSYCLRSIGYKLADMPKNYWATFALVDSWRFEAKQNHNWMWIPCLPNPRVSPEPGDIVLFDWDEYSRRAAGVENHYCEHIGIVLENRGGGVILTAEGNRGNKGVVGTRSISNCAGFIRIVG